MNEREELEALRRLAELEAKAGGEAVNPQANATTANPVSDAGRLGRGMVDPIEGSAQLLYNVLPKFVQNAGDRLNNWISEKTGLVAPIPKGGLNEFVKSREAEYQARRSAAGDTGMDWLRLGGNVLSPANLVAAIKAANFVKGTTLAPKIIAGATASGAQSAMMPVTEGDFWKEKGKQVATGATVGAAVPVVGKLMPKPTQAAKDLIKKGVSVPFLQQFGQRSGMIEDRLQSIPILGDAISANRKTAVEQFNRATWDKVLEPIGKQVPKAIPAGNKMAESAQKQISQAYDDLLPKLKFAADKEFNAEIINLRQLASGLPKEQADQFERILKTEVFDRMTDAGLMSGESIKRAESRLGEKMRTAMRSQNVWDSDLADALHEAQAVIRNTLERQNPAFSKQLQNINKAQAMAYRPERAAGYLGAKDGVFTPAQLLNSVRAKDATKNKRAFAQGNALMQDWAQQADNTLSGKTPNSGTVDRALLGGLTLGGMSFIPGWGQALAGAATIPYLPGGRMLGRGVSNVLDETSNALTQRSPYAAITLNPALQGLLYNTQDK